MGETCTIKIRIEDELDNYREEDIVKNVWPCMVPFFTRRHGVSSGKIQLNNGVFIDWKYEADYDPVDANMESEDEPT